MSEKATGTEGEAGAGASVEVERLANALRFEQAKNQVLLGEVIALEDEMVNRCMADFEGLVSDETREFWREQLLTNRDAATAALTEMARIRSQETGDRSQELAGRAHDAVGGRRPLHNRAAVRPVTRGANGEPVPGGEADDRAAKIRNRAHEISRGERIPFSAAFRRAEREIGGQ